MRATLRAPLAALASVAVLAISAFAFANPTPAPGPAPSEEEGGTSVAGMCAPGYPDCVDTVVEPGGGQSEPGSGGGAPGYPGDEPIAPPDDPGLEPEPVPEPTLVEPRPGMVGVHPIAFSTDDVVVSPDDSAVLFVSFWSGVEPCYVLDHIEVTETDETVTVTLFEGSDPAAADAVCIEIAMLKQVEITLDSPLGDRRVIDGSA